MTEEEVRKVYVSDWGYVRRDGEDNDGSLEKGEHLGFLFAIDLPPSNTLEGFAPYVYVNRNKDMGCYSGRDGFKVKFQDIIESVFKTNNYPLELDKRSFFEDKSQRRKFEDFIEWHNAVYKTRNVLRELKDNINQ